MKCFPRSPVESENRAGINRPGLKRRWWIECPLILMVAVALWYGVTTFPGKDMASNLSSEVAPVGAVQYIESHELTGCLLNWYNWGGYLIYRGILVFIDGRDDMYLASTQVFQDYVRATKLEVDPDMVLQKYGVKTVLLPNGAPLIRYLDAEPQKWKVSYRDKVAVVLQCQSCSSPLRPGGFKQACGSFFETCSMVMVIRS